MTLLEKILEVKRLLAEIEAELKATKQSKEADDSGGSNPPGPGQPGHP